LVKFWDVQIEKGIKLTKMRIKHMEKHGMGAEATKEKSRLQKQERHQQLRKAKQ